MMMNLNDIGNSSDTQSESASDDSCKLEEVLSYFREKKVEIAALREDIVLLQQQLEEAQINVDDLQQQIQTLNREKEDMKHQINNWENEKKQWIKEKNKMAKKIEKMTNNLTEQKTFASPILQDLSAKILQRYQLLNESKGDMYIYINQGCNAINEVSDFINDGNSAKDYIKRFQIAANYPIKNLRNQFGVKAKVDIKNGVIIAEYTGTKMLQSEFIAKYGGNQLNLLRMCLYVYQTPFLLQTDDKDIAVSSMIRDIRHGNEGENDNFVDSEDEIQDENWNDDVNINNQQTFFSPGIPMQFKGTARQVRIQINNMDTEIDRTKSKHVTFSIVPSTCTSASDGSVLIDFFNVL